MDLASLVAVRSLAGIGIGVLVAQMIALRFWPKSEPTAKTLPPISILKPLCGLEPRLYESLRSFCVQDYPVYQVVFGVRDPADPAIAVVRRLQAEWPDRDLVLVVETGLIGPNAKVSNVVHIMAQARYDILVLADADIRVGTDYLRALAGPVQEAGVGVVTCLYRGVPVGGVWARIGALFIQDWFVPQVLLAHSLGSSDFAFGATIALRREVLVAIGGFEALAFMLADDYELGARSRAHGWRTVLSSYLVETTVDEPRLRDLLSHQLRWFRTIRLINPWGYTFSVVTFGLPLAVIAALWAQQALMTGLAALALILRLMLHSGVCRRLHTTRHSGLVPLADLLLCGLWVAGFLGQGVRWRGQDLRVCADGSIRANRE
ncbi:MAG TPA: bacteriohopanetetrol glucosamine biosynthesis glycosyltransferase HpnI [Acidiferrobacter sp.]|nr:bacteriohopanetetrol glucosamine biosynthesis glycosyltransferase HpnI [Acidiferrobacter sp.]